MRILKFLLVLIVLCIAGFLGFAPGYVENGRNVVKSHAPYPVSAQAQALRQAAWPDRAETACGWLIVDETTRYSSGPLFGVRQGCHKLGVESIATHWSNPHVHSRHPYPRPRLHSD